MIRKIRNYKDEYQRRLARGLANGLSRSQARGHAKASEIGSTIASPIDRRGRLEKALELMKQGTSQKRAAQSMHVSTERLRSYVQANTEASRVGRKWVIRDSRPETYRIASGGRTLEVTLTKDEGTKVGLYWNAVNKFLDTNDVVHLQSLKETSVRDIKHKLYPLELRPNRLRRLDSVDELNFQEIYADVAR